MPEDTLRVKLRGIYATGLSKLFLDHGLLIVEPSIEIKERLGIDYIEQEPDVFIEDKRIKHTVFLEGDSAAVYQVQNIIANNLEESVFFKKVEGVVEVDFPISMKKRLDDLRGKILPTLINHHYYKAFGGDVSSALDMAEKLINRGESRDITKELFQKIVAQNIPSEGMIVNIEHVKLNGEVINLGKASIRVIDDDFLEFEREIKGNGDYDGLGVSKSNGDIAVSKTFNSEYYIETRYYSKDGNLKGTYININTPVEIYSSYIRYIDLDLDVIIWPDGHGEIIDESKLKDAESRGVITKSFANKIRNLAEDLLNRYLS